MTSTPSSTATAPGSRVNDASDTRVRLALLTPAPGRATTLDGAWWPRSRDLAAELPALVAELHRSRGVRVTRVAYSTDRWDAVPRRIAADGRLVRVGWFRAIDPNMVSLTDNGTGRLDLLVIPPGTPAATAEHAMALAVEHGNRETATSVLTTSGALPAPDPGGSRGR